jgi:hypothetical protein
MPQYFNPFNKRCLGGGWRWLEVAGGGWRWLEVAGGGWNIYQTYTESLKQYFFSIIFKFYVSRFRIKNDECQQLFLILFPKT